MSKCTTLPNFVLELDANEAVYLRDLLQNKIVESEDEEQEEARKDIFEELRLCLLAVDTSVGVIG
jgi:hypothetical protein